MKTTTFLSLFRRFQRWMGRPLDLPPLELSRGDVPEYLRRDVGLLPMHRPKTRNSGDPPLRDPFRLL